MNAHKMTDAALDKQITYAEGIRHGFHSAKEIVSTISGGAFTLNDPDELKAWRKRENKMRDERSVRAACARSKAVKTPTTPQQEE